MKNSQRGSVSSGGMGVFGLLGVVFVAMKLAEVGKVASWSWWWVTAPWWGWCLAVVVVAIFIAVARSENR